MKTGRARAKAFCVTAVQRLPYPLGAIRTDGDDIAEPQRTELGVESTFDND